MKEELLHFLWRHKRLPFHKFTTTEGKKIEILHIGKYNTSSGPDFLEAKLRYDGIVWSGAIEMHLKSSDWLQHGHQHDPNYKQVILHVVWKHDKEILVDNTPLPCIELANFVSEALVHRYEKLVHTPYDIPCFQYNLTHLEASFQGMRERLLIERLQRKTKDYLHNHNGKQVFFALLSKAFGTNTNQHAFQLYADCIDLQLLQRWKDNPDKAIAYSMRVSGLFTDELEDNKHPKFFHSSLEKMPATAWKTGSIRPRNQAKKRVTELIQLILYHPFDFLSVQENQADFVLKATEWLHKIQVEEKLSPFILQSILINALVPFLFLKGWQLNSSEWMEAALDLLYSAKAEENHIVRKYTFKNLKPQSAADSQALLEWYRSYCSEKKCLFCNVGNQLLRTCD